MRVKLDKDERYPDYFITDWEMNYATEIELTDEEYERVKRAEETYNEVQRFLADKYELASSN